VNGAIEKAESVLRATCGDRVRTNVPMAPLTSFRVGGPAALYLEPEHDADLIAAADALVESGIPFVVVGKGSNLLASDLGFPGLVLRLGRGYRWAAREGERLTAGGAMTLPALSGIAMQHGLSGLEFGVAIPATVGGAVRMNAGAHEGAMSDVVEQIEVFLLSGGRSTVIPAADAGFAYRSSRLPADGVITKITATLVATDPEEIRGRMDAAREWRRATQPLAEPNCGSVFKNPPGDHAARLIEESGAKGRRVGGAVVSAKHANFIVAEAGALAADVAELIRQVRAIVLEKTGVDLEPEVHLVGEFDRVPG
jgi:UDP-N-acetylmuramate dehydrogenase